MSSRIAAAAQASACTAAPADTDRLAAASPSDLRPSPMPSDLLLQGHKAIEILHNGETYRLQATRLGKLILTK